jgi:peptidoglycan/xylan/chitin deacetylase (PgdA/CDA1 family)
MKNARWAQLKSNLKKIAIYSFFRFGMLGLLRYINRDKITVLMLHGVMDKKNSSQWSPLRPHISPSELKKNLSILDECYQFVAIDECFDMLSGKKKPIRHALLVTFDDGYQNNLNYALPVCQQFNIKPVIFVSTKHIDIGHPFWFDRLDYALQQSLGTKFTFEYEGECYHFDGTTRDSLSESYANFRRSCKSKFTNDVKMHQLFNALIEWLEALSGKSLANLLEDKWSSIATWNELRIAQQKGYLDVASHGVDHWRLDKLSEADILTQLSKSKKRIEQELSDNLMALKRFSFPVNKTKLELLYLLNR